MKFSYSLFIPPAHLYNLFSLQLSTDGETFAISNDRRQSDRDDRKERRTNAIFFPNKYEGKLDLRPMMNERRANRSCEDVAMIVSYRKL